MKSAELEIIELGTFELTREVLIVSDPCYDVQTGCLGHIFDAKLGIWKATVGIKDEGEWGRRVAFLAAFHSDSPDISELASHEAGFAVGVDSGQAGIFDCNHYRDNDLFPGQNEGSFGDPWYSYCCNQTLKTEHQAGVIPYGAVATSGYGDGAYQCFYYTRGENEKRATWGVLIDFDLARMSKIMEQIAK